MALKGFMARGEQGTQTTEAATAGATTPGRPDARAPRTVSPSTSVDASSEFSGRLRCKETLRIDGRIEGEVECEKSVLVGEGAKVLASITADEVQVSGLVEGDIAAKRKITLGRTAVVVGDLTTPGIVIEEGAKLKGRILIGSEDEPLCESAEPKQEEKKAKGSGKSPNATAKHDPAPASQPVAASA